MIKKLLKVIIALLMGVCVIVYYLVTMPWKKREVKVEEKKD